MITINIGEPIPKGTIECFNLPAIGKILCIESEADYALLPPEQAAIRAANLLPDPDAVLKAQFEADQQAAKEAEWAAYKAREGAPIFKSSSVKIAAEKLGELTNIEAAIMVLVDKAADKSLLVWWVEIPQISRADAQWPQIEAAMPKLDATALFALAKEIEG